MAELEDAPWATGGGGGGADLPDAPWASPAREPINWSDVPGKAIVNAPHSAYEFGKNLLAPVLHPIDTAKSLASISGGVAEKLAPYAPAAGPFAPAIQGAAAASRWSGGNEQSADALGGFLKDRYGSLDALKHTLAEDPVGAAGDLSTILTGGGSLAARAPGIAGRVGEAVRATGSVIDPLRPITKGIEKIGEKVAPADAPWRKVMGVRLSAGQRAAPDERLPLIQAEQAGYRGQSGAPLQKHAQQFFDNQKEELLDARNAVLQEMDPIHGAASPPKKPGGRPGKLKGQILAETPYEAGEIVSGGMQRTHDMRRKVVSDYYNDAERFGGEIHPDFFNDIGSRIKHDLSARTAPVIVDDKLTPFANAALKDVDSHIAGLRAGTGATGVPGGVVGVHLKGVNVMRQRLSAFRDSAFASGNGADGRAAQAVLRSFDDEVATAMHGSFFKGDPRAVRAWDAARAAHADVRSTFGAGKDDPAGRNIEKILGRRGSAPSTATEVVNAIIPQGMNPSITNVATARRVRNALGESSPEYTAVRQGAFSRLIETPPGVQDWGAGKVADRIHEFINGKGKALADELFTAPQRERIAEYGELVRKTQVPQAGANWSNTATFGQRAVDRAVSWLPAAAGALIGHGFAPGIPGVGELLGAGLGKVVGGKWAQRRAEQRNLNQVKPQLPLISRKRKTRMERMRPGISDYLQNERRPARLRTQSTLGRYTSQNANPYQP